MANKKLESVAHFWLLGAVLGFVLGELVLILYCIREFTDWKLPWPFKGQWPPGDILFVDYDTGYHYPVNDSQTLEPYAPLDRVWDMAKDLMETLAGWAFGNIGQKALLFWWLV